MDDPKERGLRESKSVLTRRVLMTDPKSNWPGTGRHRLPGLVTCQHLRVPHPQTARNQLLIILGNSVLVCVDDRIM
jgi:hypothetical protein